MNPTTLIILDLVPVVISLMKEDADENTIITRLVRFAERQIVGQGMGSDRLSLVFSLIKQIRPAMIATADQMEKVERKISVAVTFLKDIDDNSEGWDDLLAAKLSTLLVWVDGFGNWFRRRAQDVPTFVDEVGE